MTEKIIRTYKNKKQSDALIFAQHDAIKNDLDIESYAWQEGKSGCLRFLLLGFFAFFIRPKGELTVVFVKTSKV